jgi:hypothetical protein
MTISKIPIEINIRHFSKEYADDPHCLEVILFLAKHPRTRFSKEVIVHALNTKTVYIEKTIRRLISDGIMKKHARNNVFFYSLTEDKSILDSVSNLAQRNLRQTKVAH